MTFLLTSAFGLVGVRRSAACSYVAMRILGVPVGDQCAERARSWVRYWPRTLQAYQHPPAQSDASLCWASLCMLSCGSKAGPELDARLQARILAEFVPMPCALKQPQYILIKQQVWGGVRCMNDLTFHTGTTP